MTTFEWIQTAASTVTSAGVLIAAWQLYITKKQSQSTFEDAFAEKYRDVVTRLPLGALLGRPLDDSDLKSSLRAFYEYFDLSNEQAFLAAQNRLRSETWANWREGIEQHLARPAFQQAWRELAPDLDGSFDDLKRLLPSDLGRVDSNAS